MAKYQKEKKNEFPQLQRTDYGKLDSVSKQVIWENVVPRSRAREINQKFREWNFANLPRTTIRLF